MGLRYRSVFGSTCYSIIVNWGGFLCFICDVILVIPFFFY